MNSDAGTKPLLEVEDLIVDFPAGAAVSRVLQGVRLSLHRGEVLGLVGESGSGKSVLARTLVRLESPAKIVYGSIMLDGRELTDAGQKDLDRIRGKEISLVLQNPKSAMDPVFTVGGQFREVVSTLAFTGEDFRESPTPNPLPKHVGQASSPSAERLGKKSGFLTTSQRFLHLLNRQRCRQARLRPERDGSRIREPGGTSFPRETNGKVPPVNDYVSILSCARRKGWKKRILKEIYDLLLSVGIASPEERCRQYPHQWSRGMLQRAQLLMGFLTTPKVVILDEVTSALDPTVTVQILHLIRALKERHKTGIIFITHDLSVASELCDNLAVMRKGAIVESGATSDILHRPSHPYTKQLVAGMFGPPLDRPPKTEASAIITLRDLSVRFPLQSKTPFSRRHFRAVRSVGLDIAEKEFFCLIGESGSGKTTLMNAILGFLPYREGKMIFDGQPVARYNDAVHKRLRSKAQVVFQDPVASLSPYRTLGQSIVEPVRDKSAREKERIARHLAKEVGLPPELLRKRPSEASVGQNQRACIARALSSIPELLFFDEPLSALDAVNQKEIMGLLSRLKTRHELTCFMITHDLGLVKDIGTTVAVMYLGGIVEKAPVESFFPRPSHPYSQALLSNALKPGLWNDAPIILEGEISSPHDPPAGCTFHPRCPKRLPICSKTAPERKYVARGHEVFCHLV